MAKIAISLPDEILQAVEKERFLVLTDEIAQTWMNFKTSDLERWLKGMRRMQAKMEAETEQ